SFLCVSDLFFFSSRRRHTRCYRDWSSDVCSSDLEIVGAYALSEASSGSDALNCRARATLSADGKNYILNGEKMWITNAGFADLRSEERRVGKGCSRERGA